MDDEVPRIDQIDRTSKRSSVGCLVLSFCCATAIVATMAKAIQNTAGLFMPPGYPNPAARGNEKTRRMGAGQRTLNLFRDRDQNVQGGRL